MHHTTSGLRWLLCTVALVVGCGKSASEPGLDGHQRMLTLLEEIKNHAAEENSVVGVRPLREIRQQLDSLPNSAPAGARVRLMMIVGNLHLQLGEIDAAIRALTEAYELGVRSGRALQPQERDMLLMTIAVAHLRQAETQNCIHCNNGESCLFPIQGGGVHQKQQPARKAIEYLTALLDESPSHPAAQWLLNLSYMLVGEYPDQVPSRFLIPPEKFESDQEFPRFVNIARDLGIDAFSLAGGAVAEDLDNDGWLDLVSSSWDPAGQLRLFGNNRDGTFTDKTEAAGLIGIYGGLNMVQADYDNDGDTDILVLRGAWLGDEGRYPNSLLQNDGRGRFRDVTFEAGLGDEHFPTQTAAWADFDNDGDLDLFVGNENHPCQLFENQGNGTFIDVAAAAGVLNGGFTKGCVWGDYDNDRFPDLYVSNLGSENRLYRNNRDGTFTDVAPQLGVTRPLQSFPVWFWDFNNDGNLDLFVSSYLMGVQYVAADYIGVPHPAEPLCLYRGDGAGGFEEVAREQNLTRITQPMGCNFGDLDNDGYPDFYLGTGYSGFEGLMPNVMYYNQRGTGFADVSAAGGFGHLQKGHGVAFADFDNDGDQDVFLEIGGWFPVDAFRNALFENPGFGNNSIVVKLAGQQSNRSGIGARIRVQIEEDGVKRSIYKWVNSGGSFGGNPLRQEIGTGSAARIDELEVYWPTSDTRQQFTNLPTNCVIEVSEGSEPPEIHERGIPRSDVEPPSTAARAEVRPAR